MVTNNQLTVNNQIGNVDSDFPPFSNPNAPVPITNALTAPHPTPIPRTSLRPDQPLIIDLRKVGVLPLRQSDVLARPTAPSHPVTIHFNAKLPSNLKPVLSVLDRLQSLDKRLLYLSTGGPSVTVTLPLPFRLRVTSAVTSRDLPVARRAEHFPLLERDVWLRFVLAVALRVR